MQAGIQEQAYSTHYNVTFFKKQGQSRGKNGSIHNESQKRDTFHTTIRRKVIHNDVLIQCSPSLCMKMNKLSLLNIFFEAPGIEILLLEPCAYSVQNRSLFHNYAANEQVCSHCSTTSKLKSLSSTFLNSRYFSSTADIFSQYIFKLNLQ